MSVNMEEEEQMLRNRSSRGSAEEEERVQASNDLVIRIKKGTLIQGCKLMTALAVLLLLAADISLRWNQIGGSKVLAGNEDAKIRGKMEARMDYFAAPSEDAQLLHETPCDNKPNSEFFSTLEEGVQKYRNIESVKPVPAQPICILAFSSSPGGLHKIEASLLTQQYPNFIAVYITTDRQNLAEANPTYYIPKLSYYSLQKIVQGKCQPNSLIFLAHAPIEQWALSRINQLHQTYKGWISYANNKGELEVYSFYRRLFDLVQNNDFTKERRKYFEEENHKMLALSLLELSQRFKIQVKRDKLFIEEGDPAPLRISQAVCFDAVLTPYQKLYTMDQDYKINITETEKFWVNFQQNKIRKFNGYYAETERGITQELGYQAIELEELLYLPANHSLQKIEQAHYEHRYNISKYTNAQKPLCIAVPSHNNIENNRYIKAMASILTQHYSNYHIVFMDDMSDDQTFNQTIEYLRKANFPQERVVYVRNQQRKFATYNIMHATHSYCAADDIFVLLDGDDKFIGREVFSFFNAYYHQHPEIWLAYSTYMSTIYTYGESVDPFRYYYDKDPKGRAHWMGPTRSWQVKLAQQIPIRYHQYKNGTWLDTMYDDALQFAFLELCETTHIKYLPEMTYLYTKDYGDNDNASKEKLQHRLAAKEEIYSYPRLAPLKSLDAAYQPNKPIIDAFNADKQKAKFIEIRHQ